MKLIIAIVQDDYTNKVIKVLMDNKVRATKLSSTGGFLKSGNTTLFIGVNDYEVDRVVELIKTQCESRNVKTEKDEITVGGANLFIIDIDRYIKL